MCAGCLGVDRVASGGGWGFRFCCRCRCRLVGFGNSLNYITFEFLGGEGFCKVGDVIKWVDEVSFEVVEVVEVVVPVDGGVAIAVADKERLVLLRRLCGSVAVPRVLLSGPV